MRDRIRTPWFFVPRGPEPTMRGGDSPPRRAMSARELIGRVVGNGRYLLRQKTGHSHRSVSYSALDLYGGIDVSLEIHPDGTVATGYRLGGADPFEPDAGLPDLYDLEYGGEPPSEDPPDELSQLWQSLREKLFKAR